MRLEDITQPKRPPKFKDVFETHTDTETGEIRWRIKQSGVRGILITPHNTQRSVAALRGADVKVREWSSASPANASAYHLSADFDDGGLSGMTGNYFYGPHGIWVSGRQAILRVCFLLGIADSPADNAIMTIGEIADYPKVNERTIYRLVSGKKIPAFKVAGSSRFRQSDVDMWIEENQTDRPSVDAGKADA